MPSETESLALSLVRAVYNARDGSPALVKPARLDGGLPSTMTHPPCIWPSRRLG
jgi:hypothetical protein